MSGSGRGRPAVFLDRDGTVIVDRDYPGDPSTVELLPGAARAVAHLNEAGLPVVMVTNQSGIGRGLITESQFRAVQARVEALLADAGARIDAVYHCPHAPEDACGCRKPLPGMFRRAAAEHGLDLGASWFVGDRARDVLVALDVGGAGMLVPPPAGRDPEAAPEGISRTASLAEAVERILQGAQIDRK